MKFQLASQPPGAPSVATSRGDLAARPSSSPLTSLSLRANWRWKAAAVLGLGLLPAHAEDWTSFSAGTLTGFSFVHAHHPDGRFLFGTDGVVSIQNDFALPNFTPVANPDSRSFDPAFIAVRSATSGLIGAGGGFTGPTGVFEFNPDDSASAIGAALATLQNYAAVAWRHPVSGREGWLISGTNGTNGGNTITYVSFDGLFSGVVTGELCLFSGGIATDPAGNLVVVCADFDPAVDNQVLAFTASQIDTAVAAILAANPAPLSRTAATVPLQASASGSIAIDALGRYWFGGYQINYLQAFDPATGVQRRFLPDHPALNGAAGAPTYAPRAFSQNGTDYVSFLANDGFYTSGSELRLGYEQISNLEVRSVQFALSSASASEAAGTVEIQVTITPASDVSVTIPVTASGTASAGTDFTIPSQISFAAGASQAILPVTLLDDSVGGEATETILLTLGNPLPASEAGLGAPGTERFTVSVTDNDGAPAFAGNLALPAAKLGGPFNFQPAVTGAAVTRWGATGLPPGLRIDPRTGQISGRPLRSGQFDRIVLIATNSSGTTRSRVLLLEIPPVPAPVLGVFSAVADRSGLEDLGAQVDLKTTANGSWSGRIRVGRYSRSLRGNLDLTGSTPEGEVNFTQDETVRTLTFAIDAATGAFTGSLSGSGLLTGFRWTGLGTGGPCHFLLAVPGGPSTAVPQGTGFGIVRFGPNGVASVTGRLADGTAFTASGGTGPARQIPIYQGLYGAATPGTLTGFLATGTTLAQGVSGNLTWIKPAQNPARGNYPAGWTPPLNLAAAGGRYRPVAGATLPLDALSGVLPNAELTLQDGSIGQFGTNPQTFDATIQSNGSVTLASSQRVSLTNSSGALRGSITLGAGTNRKTFALSGLLIPDSSTENPFDAVGHGYFLLPDANGVVKSGLVLLEPAP